MQRTPNTIIIIIIIILALTSVILTLCLDDDRVQQVVSQWYVTIHDGCRTGAVQYVHTITATLKSLRIQHPTGT
jgi:hypothetical protein